MTAAAPFDGRLAARLARAYGQARNCFSFNVEPTYAGLGPDLQGEIARDLAVSRSRLIAIEDAGPSAAEEMERLMRQIHVDPVEVRLRHPSAFRDMQATCALCPEKGHCTDELDAGSAQLSYPSFCANADALTGMRAIPDLLED